MNIIDVHTHIFPPEMIADRAGYLKRDWWFGRLYANPRSRMASAEGLLASMDKAGIDRAVTFGFAFADLGLCRTCNEYVLESARKRPDRLIPLALVNPRAGKAALVEARRCLESGARGIGELMPEGQGFEITDFALLDPLMALARQFGVPVLLHVNELVGHDYPGKGSQGPHQAYQCACRYPDNLLILAHWGGGLPFYELMPEVRASLRNVYYDTAATPYLYDDEIFRHVMAWAPAKVLFGTDYPLISQARFLRRLRDTGLDADALDRILWRNAWSLFGQETEGKGG
jgi:predicted TIM-barrel fold metal-dependent hydrolase